MWKIKEIRSVIVNKVGLFCLYVFLLLQINKVDASVDSLQQIWTNVAQPEAARFKAINDYYKKYLFAQPDSVILLATYHIDLAKQKKSENEIALALNNRAIAYSLKGNYDDALIEMNEVADLYSSLNDSLSMFKKYNNIAIIHSERDEYEEAIKYFSKCLVYYQENNYEAYEADILMNIGVIHLRIENYDLALDYLKKSLLLFEKLGIENSRANLWFNIAKADFGKNNYQQAITNSQTALKIFQSKDDLVNTANYHTLNAKIYHELNQIDKALSHLEKGLVIRRQIGNQLPILKDQLVLANLILPTNLNKAIKIGEEVLESVEDYNDYFLKMELYDLLYKCYQSKGDHQSALLMLENCNNYNDSLHIDQNQFAITKNTIESEYETKFSNAQFQNEQSQNLLKLNQLRRNYILLFLGAGIVLFLMINSRSKRILISKEKEVLVGKISHLKKMEQKRNQLIQSDKMASLGQLTAGVAHEINNPINFISSGVIGLKKTLDEYIKTPKMEIKDELVQDMNDMIDAIEEGARRTNTIVKSLRLFSREDTENYIEADVIKGLESTLTLLSNRMGNGIFLEKDFEKQVMPIYCYLSQLNQVFMNILLNGIQALDGTGTIKVEVIEQENNVVISIADNGPGIPDDKKEKIFEPFYTTKDIQEGTGLGLSISFGIIKKHEGSIEVIDNEPKGTRFVINLPKREERLMSSTSRTNLDD